MFLAGITALMDGLIRRFLSAKPKAGVVPVSGGEMRDRLLALNGPDVPFEVREEEGRLVAEWKIADARWSKIFYAGGINELYRVVMRLDAQRNEVRSIDQRTSVRWDVGAGGLISITASYQRTLFQGIVWEKSWEKAYGFDIRKMNFEKLYEYHFDTGIVDTVLQKEQLGTAHAVLQAAPQLLDARGAVVILYGDVPLLTIETLRRLRAASTESTMNGMSSVTISTTLCADCQPCSSSCGV